MARTHAGHHVMQFELGPSEVELIVAALKERAMKPGDINEPNVAEIRRLIVRFYDESRCSLSPSGRRCVKPAGHDGAHAYS